MPNPTWIYTYENQHFWPMCRCGWTGKRRSWYWVAKMWAGHHAWKTGCDPDYRLGLK